MANASACRPASLPASGSVKSFESLTQAQMNPEYWYFAASH